MTIGERIKFMRVLAGMSQGDLEALTDTQQAMVAKYELGRHAPRGRKLAQLADALGTNEQWLRDGQLTPFAAYRCRLPPHHNAPQKVADRYADDLIALFPGFLKETKTSSYVRFVSGDGNLYFLGARQGWLLVIATLPDYNRVIDGALAGLQLDYHGDLDDPALFYRVAGEDSDLIRKTTKLLLIRAQIGMPSLLADYLADRVESVQSQQRWRYRYAINLVVDDGCTSAEAKDIVENVLRDAAAKLPKGKTMTFDRVK